MYCFRTFFQYILVCLKVGTKNATLVDHRRPFKEKRFLNESINISENLHANRLFRRHQNKNGSIFLRICLVQDEPLPLFHIDAIFYFLLIFYLLCSRRLINEFLPSHSAAQQQYRNKTRGFLQCANWKIFPKEKLLCSPHQHSRFFFLFFRLYKGHVLTMLLLA